MPEEVITLKDLLAARRALEANYPPERHFHVVHPKYTHYRLALGEHWDVAVRCASCFQWIFLTREDPGTATVPSSTGVHEGEV